MLGSCLTCQMFLFRDVPLCDFCFDRFAKRVAGEGVMARRSPVFTQSLWSWRQDNEELSRAIVYGMKGRSDYKPWLKFATLLLELSLPIRGDVCLVPIPSKTGLPDHAFGLATALNQLTGWPVEEILRFKAQGHQRQLNRRQRSLTEITKIKRKKTASRYVLVDDVVTSGATLHAAFRALGEPDSLHALCLMDRALWL